MYLVLIRGSNIDRPLNEGSINLTHAGLQRHRVLWVREMSADEIRQVEIAIFVQRHLDRFLALRDGLYPGLFNSLYWVPDATRSNDLSGSGEQMIPRAEKV